MMDLRGKKVGGYVRMSKKKRSGMSQDDWDLLAGPGGLDRQREDIISMVSARGGDTESVVWFIEEKSAYKKRRVKRTDINGNEYDAWRVIRPVWHEGLQALRTGDIDVLIPWDLDRLARDQRDLEDGIEVVQYHSPAMILSATASSLDLTTDAGQAWARVLVTMNNKQSADTARRVKREHQSAAEAGVARGGSRPFGYKADRVTVDPHEAELIRQAAKDLLNGRSIATICREWTEQGVETPKGGSWRNASFHRMLLNPRLAGWRARKDRSIVQKDGKPVRGQWEPVLDQETFDRLERLLIGRDTARQRNGVRKYMLSGILRCGICNSSMTGNYRKDTGTHTYKCNAANVGKTGHSVTAAGPAVDALVSAQVGLRVVGQKAGTVVEEEFEGDARIAELDAMIEEAMAELRTNPKMSRVIYAHVEALEAERLETTESRSLWLAATLGPASADVTADEWLEMDVEEKRSHVLKHLDAIVVSPATRRSRTFDPERIVYVWKQ